MREHTDGDFPFAHDFNVLVQALAGEAAVLDGCEVTLGTGDRDLDVDDGFIRLGGSSYDLDAGTVEVDPADDEENRYDLVVADEDGFRVEHGEPNQPPVAPSIPDATVLLALVHSESGTDELTEFDLYDTRGIRREGGSGGRVWSDTYAPGF